MSSIMETGSRIGYEIYMRAYMGKQTMPEGRRPINIFSLHLAHFSYKRKGGKGLCYQHPRFAYS